MYNNIESRIIKKGKIVGKNGRLMEKNMLSDSLIQFGKILILQGTEILKKNRTCRYSELDSSLKLSFIT